MKNLITFSTVVLFLLLAGGCKKKDQKDFTVSMGGVRTWTGESYAETGVSQQIADTFAITIIDKTTIAVRTDTLHFSGENSASYTYTFQRINQNMFIGSSGLTYYYATGSVSYRRDWFSSSIHCYIQLSSH